MKVAREFAWVVPMLVVSCARAETTTVAPEAPTPAAPPVAAAPAPDAAPADVTIWDGVYTTAQADRGSTTARTVCFACHAQTEWTRPGFLGGWSGRPIHGLWELISATMPQDSPGGLSDQEYTDLIAYMLELNGLPPGTVELPSDEAALSRIMVTPQPGVGSD